MFISNHKFAFELLYPEILLLESHHLHEFRQKISLLLISIPKVKYISFNSTFRFSSYTVTKAEL
jgi:hypothetical protein